MDVRLLYPSEYVAAADLIEAQKKTGKDGVTLTIAKVEVETLKTNRGSEKKPVVRFKEFEERAARGQGASKRLVMNKTNARLIAGMYGNETDDWVGKRITLFPTQCEAFGERVDCVRVMNQVPQGQPAPGPAAGPAGAAKSANRPAGTKERIEAAPATDGQPKEQPAAAQAGDEW